MSRSIRNGFHSLVVTAVMMMVAANPVLTLALPREPIDPDPVGEPEERIAPDNGFEWSVPERFGLYSNGTFETTDEQPTFSAAPPTPVPSGSFISFLPVLFGPAPQKSSFELIEEALRAGELDEEMALIYQVYATFGDPLLPDAYRGDDPSESIEGQSAMRQVLARWNELKPATQRALGPFFQPPIYVGSWYDRRFFPQAQPPVQARLAPQDEPAPTPLRRPGWEYIDTPNGQIRVWWDNINRPEDAPTATTVASLMNDEVWPDETQLLGRTPISDEGRHEFTDLEGQKQVWGDGGNARLDIYLAPCGSCGGALTMAYPPGCTERPAMMVIDGSSVYRQKLEAATAHEFMHVLQFSYHYAQDCSEYNWFEEASANWAIDFVFPDNQYEYYHPSRFEAPDRPLKGDIYDGYHEWPFLLYLTRTYDPGIMKKAWSITEFDDSLSALSVPLSPGGFRRYWPEFALNLWNRPPVDFFNQRDHRSDAAFGFPLQEYQSGRARTDYTVEVKLAGQRAAQYELPITLPSLSMRYFHFIFSDPAVRSVGFSNLYVPGFPDPDVKVQALLKVVGREWELKDWSEVRESGFCRDVAAERLEELVLIFSNSQWLDQGKILKPPVLPKLTVSNVGCYQWRGTVTATHQKVSAPRTETHSATLVFERRPTLDNAGISQDYDLKQGAVHVEQTGADSSGCQLQMAPLDQTLSPEDGWLVVSSISHSSPIDVGTFSGIAGPHGYRDLTFICADGTYTSQETSQASFRTDILQPALHVALDGDSIDATQVIAHEGEGWVSTYTFHFDAVAEP